MAELRYKPWGENRYTSPAATPTTYRFTGQRQEAGLGGVEGMYYYGARWYDPATGRFLAADTIVPEPGNPQALNRYSYGLSNPLKYTDPTGHWVETAFDVVSLGMTLNDIRNEGFTFWNTISLVTDVASVILPAVPAGVSHLVRAGKIANNVVNTADTIGDTAKLLAATENAADVAKALENTGDAGDFLRAVPVDQVGTSQAFKTFKGEDGLSVFEGVSPEQVLSELPGNRVPNTTVAIPANRLPSGTRVVPTPADGLSKVLSDAHRILIRPEGWSVDRFARELKGIVGWE